MFKNWQVFIKTPMFLQAELSVDLKNYRMNKFLFSLQTNFMDSQIIKEKFLNLIVFLNKSHRINNFFRFKQYATIKA